MHALVTLHGVPLGTVDGTLSATSPTAIRSALVDRFSSQVSAHLQADGLTFAELLDNDQLAHHGCTFAAPASDQLISVVISTLGREPRLIQAVSSVLAQSHHNLELIIVDNDPRLGVARLGLAEIHDPRLRIVEQPVRGLSTARNVGVAAASGEIVAFLDDDAVADVDWLRQVAGPFQEHHGVSCVTGLVLPAQIETRAQVWFEEFGAFDKGFERLVWTLRESGRDAVRGARGQQDALFPYSAGIYGSGNNMAFRREVLLRLGGFDPALGAGTATRGGEDLDAFLRVILAGDTLIYNPSAMVRHYARRTMPEFKRQLFGYGSGMCSVILKQLIDGPRSAWSVLRRVPIGVRRLLHPSSTKNIAKSKDYPKVLTLLELSGYLCAPLLYTLARLRTRTRQAQFDDAAAMSSTR